VSDVFEVWISEEGKLFAIQTDLDEIVFYVSDDLPSGEDHEPQKRRKLCFRRSVDVERIGQLLPDDCLLA
jgi:hypothetical protein